MPAKAIPRKATFVSQVVANAYKVLAGSKDPEAHDGQNVQLWLASQIADKQCETKQALLAFEKRLTALQPHNWSPPEHSRAVPLLEIEESTPMILAPYQLGFASKDSMRGAVKTVRCLEVMTEFLESPFDSRAQPLQILCPGDLAPGAAMPDFSVAYVMGQTRACSALMVLMCVMQMDLADEMLALILPELRALMRIHALAQPPQPVQRLIHVSIGQKMSATERLRPDPLDLLAALTKCAFSNNDKIEDKLDHYVEDRMSRCWCCCLCCCWPATVAADSCNSAG